MPLPRCLRASLGRPLAALLLAPLSLACTHSESQSGGDASTAPPPAAAATLDGSVNGETFTPADAIAAVQGATAVGNSHLTLYVVIRDAPDLCSSIEGGHGQQNTRLITLQIDRQFPVTTVGGAADAGGPIPPFLPGTYVTNELPDGIGFVSDSPGPMGTVEHIGIEYRRFDATCNNVVATDGGGLSGTPAAKHGTIVLTEVSADTVAGSFDATFINGTLHGTFTARICSALSDPSAAPPTCP